MCPQSYKEFETSYKEPTRLDYIKSMFETPSLKEAYLWSHARMGGGPMSGTEYDRYLTMIDDPEWCKENADSIQRLRCRTTTGHYLVAWYRFFTRPFTMSFEKFKAIQYENAYNAWSYSQDDY